MEILSIVTQSLSALLLIMVGTLRISNPIKNYAKNSGITLTNNVDLLNELRGTSAVMLFGGIILLFGIFSQEITMASFVVGTLIFLGFALGRIISMSVDGKPNKQIIQGLIFELVLGALNAICLINALSLES